jgi:hypothetical protein
VTEKARKQLTVLAILVTVLVVVMFVVSRGEGPSGVAAPPSNRAGAPGASQQPAPLPIADVNLEALKAEHGDPRDPERNPFVFQPKAAPKPPSLPVAPSPPVDVAPPPSGPPPPPPIPLKFIGVLEIPGQNAKWAVLSDGRGGTYHAKEGQTVLGQYKLLKIGAESAEMSYVDGRGRQTLRLSGQ